MDKVIMPQIVKQEFDEWFLKKYHPLVSIPETQNRLLGQFDEYFFEFQSGVYDAYLRDLLIDIAVMRNWKEQKFNFYIDEYGHLVNDGFGFSNYNDAKIAAINEGFKLREQQLTK